MYSLDYLLQLRLKFSDCVVCDDLQGELSRILPRINEPSIDIMTDIEQSLDKYGFCFIGLADAQYHTVTTLLYII